MSIFDGLLDNWIMVTDDKNFFTIEDFEHNTGVTGEITKRHCEKCVAVNNCWFKNSKGKKPEPFDFTGISFLDSIINDILPGLYHFRCHCKEALIEVYDIEQIILLVDPGKINWLFSDKGNWIRSFGHAPNDQFINLLYDLIKNAYFTGSYETLSHDKYGFKINLFITIPGKNEKSGKYYNVKSGFMIFPNGKLKCNTLIGGWQ